MITLTGIKRTRGEMLEGKIMRSIWVELEVAVGTSKGS